MDLYDLNILPEIQTITKKLKGLEDDYFIAGGSVLSMVTNKPFADGDIDVYPRSIKGMLGCIQALSSMGEVVSVSSRAITIKLWTGYSRDGEKKRYVVQVMLFDIFPSPEHIIQHFDFYVCQAVFVPGVKTEAGITSKPRVFIPDQSVADIMSGKTRFNLSARFPFASLFRIKKYIDKGYEIPKQEVAKIALSAMINPPKTWQDFKEQLGGLYGARLDLSGIEDQQEFSIPAAIEALENVNVDNDNDYSSAVDIDQLQKIQLMYNILQYEGRDLYWFRSPQTRDYIFFVNDEGDMREVQGKMVKCANYAFTVPQKSVNEDLNKFNILLDELVLHINTIYGSSIYVKKLDENDNNIKLILTKFVRVDPSNPLKMRPSYYGRAREDLTYIVGEHTTENNPPYLFTGKSNLLPRKNNVVIEVLIDPSDIPCFVQEETRISWSFVTETKSNEREINFDLWADNSLAIQTTKLLTLGIIDEEHPAQIIFE